MEVTHAQAVRLVTKHGGIKAAARHAGVSYSTLRRRYHNIKGLEKTRLQHISKEPCAQGPKSLEDFRAAHDRSYIVPNAIKAGLKRLGKRGWEYEDAFAREISVSLRDLSTYRGDFVDYIVVLRSGRRIWAGSPGFADELRGLL